VQHLENQGGTAKFSDWSPFSVLSTASLKWLNSKTLCQSNMDALQFRPNIVVNTGAHGQPFEEDSWKAFRIGPTTFSYLKKCGRCFMSMVDPFSGQVNGKAEPLRTLKRLHGGIYEFLMPHQDGYGQKEAFFMTNIRHHFVPGQVIRVGDEVVVSSFNTPTATASHD